ncbi:MAG: type II toxin-antitoxin system HicB family antitoxin [Gemmataceae bacterium]|nr:type II toxin-antitoxin system HicB family antitoxin [Gemmataceae bacterium]
MRYAILIEKGKNNYSAYAPDVPGCVATGATLEEVKQQMKEALEFHLEGMVLDGDSLPKAETRCAYADVNMAAVAKRAAQEKHKKASGGRVDRQASVSRKSK